MEKKSNKNSKTKKIIYLASDHAGFEAKEEIKKLLEKLEYSYEDLGPQSDKKPVDYPDFAKEVAKKVVKNNQFGILICGSGTGMQIAANKIKGARAAFSYDKYSAEMARKDNDANILTLRSREFNHRKYKEIIQIFLETKFSNLARHKRRIDKLN